MRSPALLPIKRALSHGVTVQVCVGEPPRKRPTSGVNRVAPVSEEAMHFGQVSVRPGYNHALAMTACPCKAAAYLGSAAGVDATAASRCTKATGSGAGIGDGGGHWPRSARKASTST